MNQTSWEPKIGLSFSLLSTIGGGYVSLGWRWRWRLAGNREPSAEDADDSQTGYFEW